MVLAAQANADKLYADAVNDCKQQRKQALSDAEAQAKERRNATLRKGADAAQELIDNNNSRIEEAADEVVRKLIEQF